jgi:hypothetical protein
MSPPIGPGISPDAGEANLPHGLRGRVRARAKCRAQGSESYKTRFQFANFTYTVVRSHQTSPLSSGRRQRLYTKYEAN